MKTVLVEPLVIKDELLKELSKDLSSSGNEFTSYDTKPANVHEWVERTKDADQIILANTVMPKEVIDNNPNLKYINIAFTGTDHVPVDYAKEKGILVSNAAGYSDEGVAELVIGMAINILRKVKQADIGIRDGGKAADFLGSEIAGKTVGIIGTGKIGTRVAELFKAFGANLLGYNHSENEKSKELGLKYTSLEELLKSSDIITLHLPQNKSTLKFLGEKEFELMKENAIFINCARGPIVDNEALAKVLNSGKISAAVDVFDKEPPLDKDYALLNAKNTILTPHVAYFTVEAMEKRAHIVFENASDFVNGRDIKTLV